MQMRVIRRSSRFENLVRLLAEANHPKAKRPIFPTLRELMCFAAVLGFEKERKKQLDEKTVELDARRFPEHPQTVDLIYLLALADGKDAEVLREDNEDKALEVFEQYAEGGFEIISDWLKEKPEDEHGAEAILSGLAKHGYLHQNRDVDAANADVSFS
jgi:dnd system-associated protein 4